MSILSLSSLVSATDLLAPAMALLFRVSRTVGLRCGPGALATLTMVLLLVAGAAWRKIMKKPSRLQVRIVIPVSSPLHTQSGRRERSTRRDFKTETTARLVSGVYNKLSVPVECLTLSSTSSVERVRPRVRPAHQERRRCIKYLQHLDSTCVFPCSRRLHWLPRTRRRAARAPHVRAVATRPKRHPRG